MAIRRVEGYPSFLEKLASVAPLSSEDMPGLWREFVAQTTESPMWLRRGGSTENQLEHDESLSQKAERAKKAYEAALADIFKEIKAKDPKVATAALGVWNDVAGAAEFLATPSKILDWRTPMALIEDGRRDDF